MSDPARVSRDVEDRTNSHKMTPRRAPHSCFLPKLSLLMFPSVKKKTAHLLTSQIFVEQSVRSLIINWF